MVFKDKKLVLRLIATVYLVFSLPAVWYTGNKVLKKIYNTVSAKNINSDFYTDFYLEDEITGGGISASLIAHAGGALFENNGEIIAYTNSLEALEQNYKRGHRVFEIDFSLTKDGKLAAAHDWNHAREITGAEWIDIPTNEDWKKMKIYGKYTPLDINDIVTLMEKYKDMVVITDTKETQKEMINKQFMELYQTVGRINPKTLNRFIPQIYHPQMLKTIYEIYPFKNVIYTLYQSTQSDAEVLEFVKNHDSIYAVTMPQGRPTESFINELTKLNKHTYVHTVNQFDEALQLIQNGVTGLYTDYLY